VAGHNAAGAADTYEQIGSPGGTGIAGRAMIVLDASVVVELLTNGPLADSLRNELSGLDESFIAPHLLDVEVLSALRNLLAGKRIDSHRSEQLLEGLAALPAVRYPHSPLFRRIWELRHNFTAYDAAYIALAEETGAVLYTCDGRLRKGHRARVVVFEPADACS
jgi:predicted nucleic acid-binding protein